MSLEAVNPAQCEYGYCHRGHSWFLVFRENLSSSRRPGQVSSAPASRLHLYDPRVKQPSPPLPAVVSGTRSDGVTTLASPRKRNYPPRHQAAKALPQATHLPSPRFVGKVSGGWRFRRQVLELEECASRMFILCFVRDTQFCNFCQFFSVRPHRQ